MIGFSDEYYMKQALKEAELALESNEIPIGAVVVCPLCHLGTLPHVCWSPRS